MTFPASSGPTYTQCVNYTLVGNMAVEDDEVFTLSLCTTDVNIMISIPRISGGAFHPTPRGSVPQRIFKIRCSENESESISRYDKTASKSAYF